MADQISGILKKRNSYPSEEKPNTVFNAILESNLPPEEISLTRLQHEAISVTGAGIETTMRGLSVACSNILDNPPVLQLLHEELQAAIPDVDNPPPLKDLEKLPYLSACIEEALRLSYGTSQRFPRTADTSITYKDWTIPPHVTVSMDNYAVAHDEQIFPDSFAYKPSRWLNHPCEFNFTLFISLM
jgi:cytochrome P450